MSIEEKYNIIYINNKRYYKINLNEDNLDLQNTTPYSISFNGITIEDSVWGSMAVKVVEQLNKFNPKQNEELLGLKYPFSIRKKVFSETKDTNFRESINGLYLNTNFDAVRALMNIKFLLGVFGVSLDDVTFILRRSHSAEKPEVVEYYKQQTITGLEEYFGNKGFSQKKIELIVNNLEYLNVYLNKIVDSWNNLFLFDNYIDYMTTYYKLKDYLDKNKRSYDEFKAGVQTLDFLKEYYHATINHK